MVFRLMEDAVLKASAQLDQMRTSVREWVINSDKYIRRRLIVLLSAEDEESTELALKEMMPEEKQLVLRCAAILLLEAIVSSKED